MPADEEQLEYEITLARQDLETNLAELRLAVREKLDVRRMAREALARARAMARDVMTRPVVAAVAGVALLLGGLWGYRRHA